MTDLISPEELREWERQTGGQSDFRFMSPVFGHAAHTIEHLYEQMGKKDARIKELEAECDGLKEVLKEYRELAERVSREGCPYGGCERGARCNSCYADYVLGAFKC